MKKYIFFILLISFIYPRRNCLQEAAMDALGRSLPRPITQDSTLSKSGHFYIHYDTTEVDGSPPNLTDNDGNDIPDYIDEVGIMADSAYHVLIEIMGYQIEPSDSDGIYDIYVVVYPSNSYGHCVSEGHGITYVKIDNDYTGNNSNFGQTALKIMQSSLVHEYFHAIQYGYQESPGDGLGSDSFFYEMTSMWIEDVIVPDGNDYLEEKWTDALFDNPTVDFDNTGKGYELALFGHYLSSYVDLELSLDEKQSIIMKKIWEEYSNSYINVNDYDSPLVVIDRILRNEYQSSFIEAWIDFIGRNLYNGIYDNMDNPFYYYADQALIEPIHTNPQTLVDSIAIELSLDSKSTAIQSYHLSESGLFGFEHLSDDYVGRFSIVSTSTNNKLVWGSDTSGIELLANSDVHFIYGSDNQRSLTIDVIYDESCGIIAGASVWPGDTNADDIVNIYDIDPIAQYWSQNQSGVDICKRSNYSENVYQWSAQPLLDNMLLENNCISHADANGDGKVDIADILAIIINWENETSDSSDSDVEEEICNAEDLSSYFDNYSQIYSSLRGNSNAEIQLRHRLEDLFGFSPIPTSYQIYQNYPNPFNPITSIPYYLSEQADVVLSVFDLMGKQVIKKGAYIMHDGPHEIIINGQNLSTGVYFYQFKINGHEFMPKKMVLLK